MNGNGMSFRDWSDIFDLKIVAKYLYLVEIITVVVRLTRLVKLLNLETLKMNGFPTEHEW